ncbi:cell division protein FtsH, partial [bacterium]|nr:cell division protein FtsH [bacterium]
MKQNASSPNPSRRPKDFRKIVWYVVVALVVMAISSSYFSASKSVQLIDWSEFSNRLAAGKVKEVHLKPQQRLLEGTTVDGKSFKSFYIDYPEFAKELRSNNVRVNVDPADSGWLFNLFVQGVLPFVLIIGLWFFIFRQAQGANNQAMTFGKSRAVAFDPANSKVVTFNDVAGANEAVAELHEIVDYLKDPDKYREIGARIPKGVLLMGPPGTGK